MRCAGLVGVSNPDLITISHGSFDFKCAFLRVTSAVGIPASAFGIWSFPVDISDFFLLCLMTKKMMSPIKSNKAIPPPTEMAIMVVVVQNVSSSSSWTVSGLFCGTVTCWTGFDSVVGTTGNGDSMPSLKI